VKIDGGLGGLPRGALCLADHLGSCCDRINYGCHPATLGKGQYRCGWSDRRGIRWTVANVSTSRVRLQLYDFEFFVNCRSATDFTDALYVRIIVMQLRPKS